MSIKDFFIRKMIQSKLKDVPQAEQDKIFTLLEKNPELFQKIAMEVQSATASGKDQMSAMRDVMEKYKDELKDLKIGQ